jgi:hypothetical protein
MGTPVVRAGVGEVKEKGGSHLRLRQSATVPHTGLAL